MASDLDPDSGPHHKLQKKEKITTRSHCGDRGTLFFKNYDPPLHHQSIPRSAFPFQIADHRAIMPLCPSSPRQSPSSPPRTQTGKARSHKETQWKKAEMTHHHLITAQYRVPTDICNVTAFPHNGKRAKYCWERQCAPPLLSKKKQKNMP